LITTNTALLHPYPPPSLLLLTSTTGRVVAGQWRRTGWGGNDDVEGAMQSMICVIKRGSNAGREVAIQQTASAREMVAQRERRRCNNQPAHERHSARREMVA